MDRIMIIYFSLTGNTERLAQLIGNFLKEKGKKPDYCKLIPGKPGSFLKNCLDAMTKRSAALKELPDISGYDTLFLGSPVWASNITPAVRGFLEGGSLDGKNIFIFATHGGGPRKAMKNFAEAVEKKGGKIVGSCDVNEKHIPQEFLKIKPVIERLL